MFGSPKSAKCRNKVRFTSDAAAQAALNKINPTRALNKPRRVYKCPNCAGHHLTNQRNK